MTATFLAAVGVVSALLAGATLWPLWRAGKRGIWGTLVALLVVTTLGLYQLLGTPAALQAEASAPAPHTLEEGIEQLREALRQNPGRVDGWVLLARSQLEAGNVGEAAASFERAAQLAPDEPGLLVEAAQVRARAAPEFLFDDTALQWLQHARQLAPENERAIWLIGIVQRQRGQDEAAVATWESLLPRLEPAAANALREQIDIARGKAGNRSASDAPQPAATSAHAITVTVTLTPALAARAIAGSDSVFVIARVPGGPPMPVAVERHRAQSTPLTVTLDDADGPMPTQKLSALREVEVFARLSASGKAMREDGDIESTPVRVQLPTNAPLHITLGQP